MNAGADAYFNANSNKYGGGDVGRGRRMGVRQAVVDVVRRVAMVGGWCVCMWCVVVRRRVAMGGIGWQVRVLRRCMCVWTVVV